MPCQRSYQILVGFYWLYLFAPFMMSENVESLRVITGKINVKVFIFNQKSINGLFRQLSNHVEVGVMDSGSTYILIISPLLFISLPCLIDGFFRAHECLALWEHRVGCCLACLSYGQLLRSLVRLSCLFCSSYKKYDILNASTCLIMISVAEYLREIREI